MITSTHSKRLHPVFLVLLTVLVLFALRPATAQDEIRTERIEFERGANRAVIEGSITGHEIVDYILHTGKGQLMNISMATDHTGNYFNLLAPGEDRVAIFNGSIGENQFEGMLPDSGDYTVRVYLMRSAARRNEVANYHLEMIVTATTVEADDDAAGSAAAVRAGQGDFDATGQIPCAQHAGQPMGQCNFGVSRAGGGSATVVITRPDGTRRALFFIKGMFSSADTSQADGYPEYSAERQSDLNLIRVGE